MGIKYQINWHKVVTREYSTLWASYTINAYKIMKKQVGTTLAYNLFYGKKNLLTIYRDEKDITKSYQLIEKKIKKDPKSIIEIMDIYDQLIKEYYALIKKIQKQKNKTDIKTSLLQLDKHFQKLVCYYLFIVFVGYTADLTTIKRFVTKHQKRFKYLRMQPVDIDMHKLFPQLFSKFDPKLKTLLPYLTRKELQNILNNKKIDLRKIRTRMKKYLFIVRDQKLKEYPFSKIDQILKKELPKHKFTTELTGQVAYPGKIKGRCVVVDLKKDYQKIKPEDILVTSMTKQDMIPYLKKVKGIVTNDGGALSHASIIARELKIPCLVGTTHATDIYTTGDTIELNTFRKTVRLI